MASIVSRRDKFCVVYPYTDAAGKRHQKWETFPTMEDAKKRKTEIEYKQITSSFTIPECTTLSELLDEYVELYGKTKWSISMYTSNMGLIRNYIKPQIGNLKLSEINDVPDVMKWIEGDGAMPRTCTEAYFTPTRLLTMQSRQSAAYKGIMALILKNHAQDLISGREMDFTVYQAEKLDIHHIFPQDDCVKCNY